MDIAVWALIFALCTSFRIYLPRCGRLVLCMILKGNSRLARQGLPCTVVSTAGHTA